MSSIRRNLNNKLNTVLTHLPQCLRYALVNRVIIGTENGLPPIRRQALYLNRVIVMLGYSGQTSEKF